MKKTIAYLIIALFLISVVAAQPLAITAREKEVIAKPSVVVAKQIATETTESCIERLSKINPDVAEEELKKRCTLRETNTQRLKAVEARRIQKLNELKQIQENPKLLKYKKANAFKARKIAQAKLTSAKQNYVKAKERYLTARRTYISAQNNFREAKGKLKACKEDTEECNQLREQTRERAKEFLLKTADNILEHLNKIKAKVESNEDLSEEEANEILEKIDGMIKEIEDAKSTIESSEDKDEIIEAAKIIKQAWVRIRKRLAIHTGRIINARIGGIIVKIKQLEVKLEKILERMEEKGIDTSEIQTLVDDFNAKTNEAKENYESALDKFKEAASKDVKTAHELAVEGHRYMKAAHKSLQEAQKLLRDIVLSIKQKGGQEELTAVTEEEAEEESSLTVEGGESE